MVGAPTRSRSFCWGPKTKNKSQRRHCKRYVPVGEGGKEGETLTENAGAATSADSASERQIGFVEQ